MAHLRIPYEVASAAGGILIPTKRGRQSIRQKAAYVLLEIIECAWNAKKGVTGFVADININTEKEHYEFWIVFYDLVQTFESYVVDKRNKSVALMLADKYNHKIKVVVNVSRNWKKSAKRGRSVKLITVDGH